MLRFDVEAPGDPSPPRPPRRGLLSCLGLGGAWDCRRVARCALMMLLMFVIMAALVSLAKGGGVRGYYDRFAGGGGGRLSSVAPALSGGGGGASSPGGLLGGDPEGESGEGEGGIGGVGGEENEDDEGEGDARDYSHVDNIYDENYIDAAGARPEGDCGLFWDGLALLTARATGGGEGAATEEREVIKMCPSGLDLAQGCPTVAGLLNYAEPNRYEDLALGFCACQAGREGGGESAWCSPAFDFSLQKFVMGVSCTDFAEEIGCDQKEGSGAGGAEEGRGEAEGGA